MKALKTLLFAAIGLCACSLQINAQSCKDLYKQAEALRKEKNYADAITYYQRAKSCDRQLVQDCEKRIKYCREHLPFIDFKESEIRIPYQGGDKKINVESNVKWATDGMTEWCNTDVTNPKELIVQCREANNSTREKTATLLVKSGSIYKSLKVVQEARPEYITASAERLNFPADGTEDDIKIESNAKWNVTSVPSWCKIEQKEDGIHIIVSPNKKVMERTDDIVIVSPKESVTIKITQSAGEEHLTLSQNDLVFNAAGDTHYIRVYTDADNWFVGDFPTWMNVQRVGKDSLRIDCGKNLPNGEIRSGSVQVRTDRQTAGVSVKQNPRQHVEVIFPDSKLVSGRNLSFGISASYYMPFVGASAGGDYVGSVLDYGLGTSAENASYKSGTGFSLGVFADMRLYKNIFLIAGVNFTQVKYKNEFNQNTIYTMPCGDYEYMKGEVQNSYTESYTHTMIEVPILASYRFKINNMSHVQLNLGPVLDFGLTAKMNQAGNTDSETMKKYSKYSHQQVDNGNYLRHTAVNADFNLYQPCVYWEESYTTGNDAVVAHHDTFLSSPLKKFNCGLRIGAAYEWAGISAGLYYTYMLTNMANKNYWENERWTVLNVSEQTMKGYSQRINALEFKLSYTLRYLKSKKH